MGNAWITGNWGPELNFRPANMEKLPWDRQALKFSKEGKLLLEIGHPSNGPANNQDTTILGAPSSIQLDEEGREVFIGDGYKNKRVVVYDSETGAFKRGWGAYGMPLSEIDNSKPEGHYDPAARRLNSSEARSSAFDSLSMGFFT